jgi:catechol 2,3-dioxygenase-like lactoylglutathione lyase family enzyme
MPPPPISGLVPMLHVADVARSIAFYKHLGFEVGNREPKDGPIHWCWLYQPAAPDWKRGANLMLATSECPIQASAQSSLFYLYAADLVSLREQLLAQGLKPGEITYPFYLPKGELQLRDPDGFVLMIAQSFDDTP